MSTLLAWVGVYCVVVVLAVGTWTLVHEVVRRQSPQPPVTPIASPDRLPRRIPAPPAMTPRPDLEAALRADIETRLRLLGDELRNDPEYHLDMLDRLFADSPRTTDH